MAAQGVAVTGSPESRKGGLKRQRENEAKTKACASSPNKSGGWPEINVRRKKNWRRMLITEADSVPKRPLLKNSSDTGMSEGTVERTFQRRLYSQPYCRRGQHIPLDNPCMRLEEGHRLMLHDQHWVTEQGFSERNQEGTDKGI